MYAELADILEQMDVAVLILVTDDDGLGEVDQSVVDRAIVNAGSLIDGYCRDRYVVPFDPVPEMVRMFAVDLAVFNLYSRRTHVETPAIIIERQKQALDYLRRVQDGKATIDAPAKTSQESGSSGASFSGNERLFTRASMKW